MWDGGAKCLKGLQELLLPEAALGAQVVVVHKLLPSLGREQLGRGEPCTHKREGGRQATLCMGGGQLRRKPTSYQ